MITLADFADILADLNHSLRTSPEDADMFERPQRVALGGNTFGYEFNGLIFCVITIMPDGRVVEWADCNVEDGSRYEPVHYGSVDVWKKALVEALAYSG